MNDREALYRTICAHPDDDAPRLVFADWLQEHGDEDRAEFIRVQCCLAQMTPDHPDYYDLREREKELLWAYAGKWLRDDLGDPFKDWIPELTWAAGDGFDRGFPALAVTSVIDVPTRERAEFVRLALQRLINDTPTRVVQLNHMESERTHDVFQLPEWEEITGLRLGIIEEEDLNHCVEVIANSSRMSNLRSLDFAWSSHSLNSNNLIALAQSSHLQNITELTFNLEDETESRVLKDLFKSPLGQNLRKLHIRGGVRHVLGVLVTSECLTQFQSLSLDGSFSDVFVGLEGILSLPHVTQLTIRALRINGLRQIADRIPNQLREFVLDWSELSGEEAERLFKSSWLTSLRSLRISGGSLQERGICALAESSELAGLRNLELYAVDLNAGALEQLAEKLSFSGLTQLNISETDRGRRRLKTADLSRFLENMPLHQLRHLTLLTLPVGSKGAKVIASEKFQHLRILSLVDAQVRDTGAAALFDSPCLDNLIHLNLGGNPISDTIIARLADPAVLPNLLTCDLRGIDLKPKTKSLLEVRFGDID